MDRSITTDLLKKITGSRAWVAVFLLYTGAIFYLALKPMDPQGRSAGLAAWISCCTEESSSYTS